MEKGLTISEEALYRKLQECTEQLLSVNHTLQCNPNARDKERAEEAITLERANIKKLTEDLNKLAC